MIQSLRRWILLGLLINFACSGPVMWRFRERVHSAQYQRAKQHVLLQAVRNRMPLPRPQAEHLRQPLDHFDGQNKETFHQRYFVNDVFWDQPNGPVFLFIGGESPLTELSVLAGHHVDMAVEHGALLLALEHRFYGDSINPDGLQTENLKFLSSQQALADLAAFHRHASRRFSLSHANTWLTFGGSYSGALAAWLRGKFPHLIYGAVASSAPVRAQLDFSTYNRVVGFSLTDESVGGSIKCMGNIWEAFAAVEAILFGGNASEVGRDFGCCQTPSRLDDQMELMQSLADIVIGTVQYNKEGGPLTIAQLCDVMTNQSEAYDQELEAYHRFVKLVAIFQEAEEAPCLDVSHQQVVLELQNTSRQAGRSGHRQWFYQTCNEFGFYQTCEDASCPFSRLLTLQSQTQFCPLLFNIPQSSLPARVAFTNQYYGADKPGTERVLYVNGNIDPWKELSVLSNRTQRDEAILIPGTAHCADMGHTHRDDTASLQQARQNIEQHVSMWLKSAPWEHLR